MWPLFCSLTSHLTSHPTHFASPRISQGTDPRTDLRGAGGMSLTHFATYLLRAHGEEEDTGFPLSIASINCTGMLQAHLQLNPTLAVSFAGPGGGKVEPCSAETLHRFLHLASSRGGPDTAVASLELVLTQMHGALLDHLRSEWRALQGEARGKSPLTIMDFPRALHATHAHLQRTLATFGRHRTWGVEQLVDELAAGRVGVGAGFGAGMGAGLGAGLGLGGCQMEGLRAAWECLFVTPMAAAFLVLRDVLRTLNGALGCGGDCYRPSLKHHQS